MVYLLSKNLPPIALKVTRVIHDVEIRIIRCFGLQEVLEELRPVMQPSKNSNNYPPLGNFEKDTPM